MRILFNIGHPAQVHFFKNAIWDLQKRGHICKITTSDKDVAIQLLKAYKFEYEIIGKSPSTLLEKAIEMVKKDWKLLRIAHRFKPDVLVGGVGNLYVAHVGKIIGKPSIVFDDTEHSKFEHMLMDPFVTRICTPEAYTLNLGRKQVRYSGFKELAYLHAKYFKPRTDVLKELGLNNPDEKFVIIRLVSWNAAHDVGINEVDVKSFKELVEIIVNKVKVIITAESHMGAEFEMYKMKLAPENLHDLLYFATMYIGEGATMATEAALLGTPSIYVNPLNTGTLDELSKANLITHCESWRDALSVVKNNVAFIQKGERQTALTDFDVTSFIVNQIDDIFCATPHGTVM
ncbi:MAG: DUF354 domain-containing protein [Methanobacteriota archaeon]